MTLRPPVFSRQMMKALPESVSGIVQTPTVSGRQLDAIRTTRTKPLVSASFCNWTSRRLLSRRVNRQTNKLNCRRKP